MDRNQIIDMYLMNNSKYFPNMSLGLVRSKLESLNESQLMGLGGLDLKDPTMMLIVSVVAGTLGIDRFLIGDFGMGILKLLTMGVCGIMSIVDWFLISNRTKDKNLAKLMAIY